MQAWTKPLRPWQQRAYEAFNRSDRGSLIMATPAAGKTTLALKVAHDRLFGCRAVDRVVIVVPTDHLRRQWTTAAAAVGIDLDPDLHSRRCVEARDYVGAVVTYQQVALKPAAFAVAPSRRRTLVVFDEIHHAADGKEWGDGLRQAFGLASYRLALSGTPFRSDDSPIPFVRYDDAGICQPEFSYGYGEAVADGVCRPIYFPSYEGSLTWSYNGKQQSATFADELLPAVGRRRLKTALLSESWMERVLLDANDRLSQVRQEGHANAGGLVIAMNQKHAREVAVQLGRATGTMPAVAISDDPDSSDVIKAFEQSHERWLVAVNMVSEGVDIPRLRVGVYATNVSTEMYFRQVVGRFVRMRPELGTPQRAWLYVPKDPALMQYAQEIQAEREHAIPLEPIPADEPSPVGMGAGYRSPASFLPISGVAVADRVVMMETVHRGRSAVIEQVDTLAEQKEQLRARHRELVGLVAKATRVPHREVYLSLIKLDGARVESATVQQLERRIRVLGTWRERGYL